MTHLTERLSDYIDGSLSPSEREEVERHLAECEECANTLADLRGVVARVQALNDRPPRATSGRASPLSSVRARWCVRSSGPAVSSSRFPSSSPRRSP